MISTPSLLDLARLFLPVNHLFSCAKVRRNKLHPFSKISADVFSLLHFKFGISSPRRSCLVGVDVSCSGFMEAGSRRSLGLRPMDSSMGVLPLEVTCVFVTVAALRINWAGVICAKVVRSRLWEAVSTSAKRNFLNNRTPISARFGHGVCGPVGISLHVVHSVECMHVVRMVKSNICTNRLRAHLERVHPLMKLSNTFRTRSTFCMDRLSNVMWLHPKQSEIRECCLQSLPILVSTFFCPKSAHARSFRSRLSRNCRTGMSSPRVHGGHIFPGISR